MKYSKIVKAEFIERPNRFIAHCVVNGKKEVVHVKNTGRCRELLVKDCCVYLEESDNPQRKTKYDLVAVEKVTDKRTILINMDSQAPNKAAGEWIKSEGFKENLPEGAEVVFVKSEFTYGKSRFDFYIEYKVEGRIHKMFLEVKGVTLEENGVVLFPDAPTERGVKHLRELALIAEKGEAEAAVLFVVQMDGVEYFTPNRKTHPEFADALFAAEKSGVKIIAMDCKVTADSMTLCKPVKVEL